MDSSVGPALSLVSIDVVEMLHLKLEATYRTRTDDLLITNQLL